MSSRRQKFDALVAAVLPQLYRYAYWLGRDQALAEDVVQEALMRAWRSIDSLTEPAKAKSWLLTIVRREHARHYEGLRPLMEDIDDLDLADTEYSPVEREVEADDMRRLIGGLHADYREPLVLQVVMGYTAEEIAEIMGITRAAVLTRLFRARKQLADRVAAPMAAGTRGGA